MLIMTEMHILISHFNNDLDDVLVTFSQKHQQRA